MMSLNLIVYIRLKPSFPVSPLQQNSSVCNTLHKYKPNEQSSSVCNTPHKSPLQRNRGGISPSFGCNPLLQSTAFEILAQQSPQLCLRLAVVRLSPEINCVRAHVLSREISQRDVTIDSHIFFRFRIEH
ncbi:hypothetical protein LSTR_LSTR013782 [Laodelphax striatellus]|uniref:Uncharacterized protein n=1 Tax=Laodelphax striatellus TaxID=195883 RepID=A0A482XGB0_LAOST|nr:hypothetical protein LSTR_LSTR013782 [Laodelphax striatellus]